MTARAATGHRTYLPHARTTRARRPSDTIRRRARGTAVHGCTYTRCSDVIGRSHKTGDIIVATRTQGNESLTSHDIRDTNGNAAVRKQC